VSHRFSRSTILVLAGLIPLAATLGWEQTTSASDGPLTSVDQIDQSYQVPVTDPATHVDYPSTLEVDSAELDTTNPVDSSEQAPAGFIYLTFDMSSEPAQVKFGDPTWGDFYSNMAPFPATALRYVTASGRSYVSTRVSVDTQASFANADGNDGLVDATYYFTIPIAHRNGTLEILPSRTSGMRYENFQGVETTTLVTGGPTRIPLHLPMPVAVAAKASTTKAPRSDSVPFTTFASMLNFVSTILGLLLVAAAYLWIRRARRRHFRSRRPVYFTHQGPTQSPPVQTEAREPAAPSTRTGGPRLIHSEPDERLHVNVLGSLTISPADGPMSDPVRAIVAYLATHTERPLTLDEIQNTIWPLTDKGNDIKRPAMRNYMANARKAVGDRYLPTAAGRPGYQLVDATTDWAEFQKLTDQARSVAKPDALELRKQALSLVRGEPFTADTSRYFTWAFSSTVVYKIVEAVTTLAHSLGTELVLASDLGGAEWAVRQALLCDPASMTLWEDLTDVLLETADQSLLDLHWKAAALVLESKDVVALRARENG
jgi:DNA-binding SARP family transcriptional activator